MEERKNRNYDRRPRQPRRDVRPDPETAENLLEGRNALTEALAAGRAIDKVYLAEGNTDRALARLAAMEGTDDGLELAAFDLSLRREGDILGNRQSGASTLKLVNVVRDAKVIEAAHADAVAILDEDPELTLPEHQALSREIRLAFNRK